MFTSMHHILHFDSQSIGQRIRTEVTDHPLYLILLHPIHPLSTALEYRFYMGTTKRENGTLSPPDAGTLTLSLTCLHSTTILTQVNSRLDPNLAHMSTRLKNSVRKQGKERKNRVKSHFIKPSISTTAIPTVVIHHLTRLPYTSPTP